ncbi:MAG: hypothetical protein LBL05_02415 [Synergistaceae bacterium]|jgi:hypothetical protein|nr:hypothetical protein [Synergistaceae bacterium]
MGLQVERHGEVIPQNISALPHCNAGNKSRVSELAERNSEQLLNHFLQNMIGISSFLSAPGSADAVDISGNLDCLEKVLRYIAE